MLHYFLVIDLSTVSRMRETTSYIAFPAKANVLEQLESGMRKCLSTKENRVWISEDENVTKEMIAKILKEARIPCSCDKIIYDAINRGFNVYLYS